MNELLPLIGTNIETGEERICDTWKEVIQQGCCTQSVRRCCLGIDKQTKGWKWECLRPPYNFEKIKQRYKKYKKNCKHTTWGTIEWFKRRRWESIHTRTINGKYPQWKQNKNYLKKGIRVEMTQKEFFAWCDTKKDIIEAIIKQGEIPSLDRIDDNDHYSVSNLRIISNRENIEQMLKLRRKPIYGFLKWDTTKTINFESSQAAQKNGFYGSNILQRLKNPWLTYKGYYWRREPILDPQSCIKPTNSKPI